MVVTENTVSQLNAALLAFHSLSAKGKLNKVNVTNGSGITEEVNVDLPEFVPADTNQWGYMKYGKLAICYGQFVNQASTSAIYIEERYFHGITNWYENYTDRTFPFAFKKKPIVFFRPISATGYPGTDHNNDASYCQVLSGTNFRIWDGYLYSVSWPITTTYSNYYCVFIGEI